MVMHHFGGADGSRPIITGIGISISGGKQTGKSRDSSDGDTLTHRKKDKLVHAAGDERGYDLHGRLKGKSVIQLKEIIKKIYLTVGAGPRTVMEDILNNKSYGARRNMRR